ncbi:MAG: TetR family transcriptional regulator [Alphaproteobacteria bacterium]|nr:TetR family transcriptional regulator [Alphaproteobacteria bacterium]
MGKRPNSRALVLDAADALVSEVGANHMSLDAVAARAGISKGGLLYLFPSKVALLQGMLERYVERLENGTDAGAAKPKLSEARRLLKARYAARGNEDPDKQRTGSFSMIAAIAEQPKLLDPVRSAHKRIWSRLKKGTKDPELALLAWFALEGLLFVELFATSPLTRGEHDKFMKRLEKIADEASR